MTRADKGSAPTAPDPCEKRPVPGYGSRVTAMIDTGVVAFFDLERRCDGIERAIENALRAMLSLSEDQN
jgi:hypothetical protein